MNPIIYLLHYTLFEGMEKMEIVMSLHKDYDDSQSISDFSCDEDIDELDNKKRVRRMIEDRLERKRLKDELEDELDNEFNWDDLDR